MMERSHDYAFPLSHHEYSQGGITQRDYFAGQAIIGLLSVSADGTGGGRSAADYAAAAYQIADAMMLARFGTGGGSL